jgi:hypothetical protein
MNDENPFQPPRPAQVAAEEKQPRRNKAVLLAMYVWIVVTFVINGAVARVLLELTGIPATDLFVLFGREMLVVYVIISSLALFRCKPKTYAITTAIVIAALFVRSYLDCVAYGSMDGLLNIWLSFSVVTMATSYLYVAESFLIRRMKSPTRA